MVWIKGSRLTRERCTSLFLKEEILSIQFIDGGRIVHFRLLDDEYKLPEEKYKSYQIAEYFNNEEVFESNLLSLETALNEIEKYGFFEEGYNGKILLNNYDPDKIPEPPLDENGVLITREEMFKLIEIDEEVLFTFKKSNEILENNIIITLDERTHKLDMSTKKHTIVVLSKDKDIEDIIFESREKMIMGFEELGVMKDGKGYVYKINEQNPRKFLDKIRNHQ